jgi:hypothetical protein
MPEFVGFSHEDGRSLLCTKVEIDTPPLTHLEFPSGTKPIFKQKLQMNSKIKIFSLSNGRGVYDIEMLCIVVVRDFTV